MSKTKKKLKIKTKERWESDAYVEILINKNQSDTGLEIQRISEFANITSAGLVLRQTHPSGQTQTRFFFTFLVNTQTHITINIKIHRFSRMFLFDSMNIDIVD